MEHFFHLDLDELRVSAGDSYFRISRTTSWKQASSLIFSFADASKNVQTHCLASSSPVSFETSRSVKSHLLPTSTIGTTSASFARRIFSRMVTTSSKLLRKLMAYTRRNPF